MFGADPRVSCVEGVMSQEERYGAREQTYSAWHRRNSTRRFAGMESAQLLAMIDLDVALYLEYDDGTKEPLALVEVARDCGQRFKAASVTMALSRRTVPVVPAYAVLYLPAELPNPADPLVPDIESFRVRRLGSV